MCLIVGIHLLRGTPGKGIADLQPLLERLERQNSSDALAISRRLGARKDAERIEQALATLG